jgi:hypothetical protein
MVAAKGRNLVMVNPLYWIIPPSTPAEGPWAKGHSRWPGGGEHS